MKPTVTLLLFIAACAFASPIPPTNIMSPEPAAPALATSVTLVTVAVDLDEMAESLSLTAINCRRYAQLVPEGAAGLNAQADAYAAASARVKAESIKIVLSLAH